MNFSVETDQPNPAKLNPTANKFRKAFVTLTITNFLGSLMFLAGFALTKEMLLLWAGLALAVAGIGIIVFWTMMKRKYPSLFA